MSSFRDLIKETQVLLKNHTQDFFLSSQEEALFFQQKKEKRPSLPQNPSPHPSSYASYSQKPSSGVKPSPMASLTDTIENKIDSKKEVKEKKKEVFSKKSPEQKAQENNPENPPSPIAVSSDTFIFPSASKYSSFKSSSSKETPSKEASESSSIENSFSSNPWLSEPPKPSDLSLEELKKLLEKFSPSITQTPTPSDALAKRIAQEWKYKNQAHDITVFLWKETAKERVFLENLAKALDRTFLPSKVVFAQDIEKNNQWESFLSAPQLKLIILCDYSLVELPLLLKHYHEHPSTSLNFLGKTPLFMIPKVSLYLQNPLLKSSLLKALSQKIASLTLYE